jgi:uncharacterized membrane protein YraQ (UPF0718 family)
MFYAKRNGVSWIGISGLDDEARYRSCRGWRHPSTVSPHHLTGTETDKMNISQAVHGGSPWVRLAYLALISGLGAAVFLAPDHALATARFVFAGLINVTPIVIPGILLAAWIAASGASDRVADIIEGQRILAVFLAAGVGALIPVCGITVLPLMAGLLAAGVPLAPVMAFWLSSPVTGPPMFAATAATLGWEFAVGKMIAAIGLGIFGGLATAALERTGWTRDPLRRNRITGSLGQPCGIENASFHAAIWTEPARRARFGREAWSVTRLILIVLIPAFAAEYALNETLAPDALSSYVGAGNAFAVPLAVLVGAPAYIDGYAALPLTRALMEAGMAPGAAMAFLVSGGVVSIWGAMAIAPVLRIRPFLLYLLLASVGSMLSGWAFEAWTSGP